MQKNNVVEYRCRQLGLVELMFNMSTILLYDRLQATPQLVDTLINELIFAALRTGRRRLRPMSPSTGNPASTFFMSRSRLCLHQALLGNSSRKRQELQFFCTRNAFMAIFCPLALFYPSQCTNALLFNSATFIKTGSYSQNYYYKHKG